MCHLVVPAECYGGGRGADHAQVLQALVAAAAALGVRDRYRERHEDDVFYRSLHFSPLSPSRLGVRAPIFTA